MSKQKTVTIKCENEECEFFGMSEEEGGSFLAVVYYMETRDFELSEDGEIGTDLTIKENENLHVGFRVRDVRCRHCDEDIPFPRKWEKRFDDTFTEDFKTLVKQK